VTPPEPLPVPLVPVDVVPYDPAWVGLYRAESERVRGALGRLVDGGVLEELEHIGSTSVPGLQAKPTIDMMGRIHPYPPSQESIAALAAIGYTWRGEYGLPGRTYFTKGPHDYHLHLVGFESDHWERHRVFPAYLRASQSARERYGSLKLDLAERFHHDRPAYQDGKTPLVTSLAREATEWHVRTTGFSPVERLASAFDGLPDDGLWAVSSGWALDLHLGAPSRYHDDLDVEVDVSRQSLVHGALLRGGWRLDQVIEGGRYLPWLTGEPLVSGSHQAHARRDGEFIDLLFAPRGGGEWRFRRDERVTLPLERALLRAELPSGRRVRYLCPEAVLLFKSRSSQGGGEGGPRGKDDVDFARVLPTLDVEARAWLAAALRVVHGEHQWIAKLTAGA
jgi:GrpB-like predicted nucleotidyltransferase (UPF0157 family)